jgi:glucose-6-phosphate dehydrogenase assembly protein OpcA
VEAYMTEYIQPKEIEKKREALWKKYQGTSAVKASLFNLVIFTKDNVRKDYFQKIARQVIRKFPCTIINITEAENSTESYLRTFVSDLQPENNANSIFCDMTNFEVSGASRNIIPSLVIRHIQEDLPTYFLWADDPSKRDPIALELKDLATRVVFDSETAESIAAFAKTLLELHEKVECDIGDLNWARLAPWRGLFVHTFNDPEKLKSLRESKEIRITYNIIATEQYCHTKIQATYFASWIAIKLGWTYESSLGSKDDISFKYKSENGPLTITILAAKNDQVPPGRILKFESFSIHNEHLLLEKNKQNPLQVKIQHSTSSRCEMPVYYLLDKETAGKSMIHEIYSQGTRGSFIDILKVIALYNPETIC